MHEYRTYINQRINHLQRSKCWFSTYVNHKRKSYLPISETQSVSKSSFLMQTVGCQCVSWHPTGRQEVREAHPGTLHYAHIKQSPAAILRKWRHGADEPRSLWSWAKTRDCWERVNVIAFWELKWNVKYKVYHEL